ncbi:MAG: histidine kinase [Thermomicrobiales bacterium]
MAISAVRRPTSTSIQTWLATNWPAALWLTVAVVITVAGSRNAPEQIRQAVAMTDMPAKDREEMRRSLAGLHLTPAFIGWFEILSNVIGTIVNVIVGWLLVRKPPRTGFAIYLAFVLLAFTETNYPPDIANQFPGQPITQTIIRFCTVFAVSGFFTLPFIFPNGRFVPRWTIILGAYNVYSVAAFAFFPDRDPLGHKAPAAIEVIATTTLVASAVGAMIYRYIRVSTPKQRQQTRWVMFGLMIGIPGFFIGDALMRNISSSPAGVASLFGFLIIMPIATTLPTITLGIAILQYRLFDIDVILSRTLVWVVMTIAIIGTYIGVVVGIGTLIGSRSSLLLSLMATGLVAVGFQPLLHRVRRITNRFLFGDRDDPYAVLARLGHHIEDTLNSAELLPQIVRTTAEALRLPYAALFLERADGPILVASSGIATPSTLRLPLMYQGQSVGALEVATRTPGEVFGQADRRLLEDLARQIGAAARTVNLATDLQQSRERIVISREEERRRLRRDLHDGLGAQLAALIMQAGAARSLIRTDPNAAEQELADLRDELRSAVAEVRRLVLGLRPPALDELGLIGALRAWLARLDGGGIDADSTTFRVRFDADEPLPLIRAAAEVAAYRIVEEAVTNVVKHAHATTVAVSIRLHADSLLITVADDGVGLSSPAESAGIGLQTMRERAVELGGTFTINPGPQGLGTQVSVTLPIAPGTED